MIPAFLLIVAAVAYRIVTGLAITSGTTWLSNFAPMAAIALCGAAYFPTRYKFTVPLIALFISDIVLNIHYSAPMLDPLIACRYLALIVVGLLGWALSNRASWKTLLPASLAGSILFYAVTNAFAWLSDPGYARNFAGLIQALTLGLPQYSSTPSWMFFRNSVVSDLLFTGLFILCLKWGRTAILTAHAPLAVGIAFAAKHRGEDRVPLCFFGDGAINQGAFHEALNLAALYKLPVVFVCENNLFAMGTSVERSTSLKQLVDRAEGYEIPATVIDGMNFREVRDKLSEIISSIRGEPHPACAEVRTDRYRGHAMSDAAG